MKITYDELRRIQRLEKNTSSLVEVDDEFIDSVETFVDEQKKIYLASLKDFSSSDAREFANLKRVVEEIFLLREKKLLNKALIASRTDDSGLDKVAKQERDTFKKILKILSEHDELCTKLFGERREKKSSMTKLTILKDVPTFVGTDMKEYGPFSDGDEVELPEKVAKLFIMRKLARE
jgi:DNA replication initiation complex subunit (GINS family)